MNQEITESRKKDRMAFICIIVSVVALIAGIAFPIPMADSFSPGALASFVAFLASLGSVKDKGSNLPALLAFALSFSAMTISIFCMRMAM